MIIWKWSNSLDVLELKELYCENFKRYLEVLESEERIFEDDVQTRIMALEIRDELDKEILERIREIYAKDNL
jgi:hypothetical protein